MKASAKPIHCLGSSLLVLSLLLCVGVGMVSSQTTSQILLGNWQVIYQAGITCDTTTCCCFNGNINGYLKSNENYLNGTATGQCRKASQQDNLDAPAGYVWTAEFLGIDSANFVLSNLTYNNQTGISMTMNTSTPAVAATKQKCGFQMWRAQADGLPATPASPATSSPGTAAPPSAYVQEFVGTWYADQSCDTASTLCCCLTNTVTITSSSATQSFTINGTASVGCGAPIESDDFPWPVDAFSANNGFNASVFPTADNYIVDYTAGMGGGPNTIVFNDQTRTSCSFKLYSAPVSATTAPPTATPAPSNTTTSAPTTPHSQAAGQVSCALAIAFAALAVFFNTLQ